MTPPPRVPEPHRVFLNGLATLLIVALPLTGCGGGAEPPPVDVHPVSGTVTFNGSPVAGATVTYKSQTQARGAFGVTDQNGVYKLTTFSNGDGAVAGKHDVTVTKIADTQAVDNVGVDMESEEYDPLDIQTDDPEVVGEAAMLPPKFSNAATSGLSAEVVPGEENVLDLKLTL